ncbi:MAG: VTT domain-containing protein [Pseudomonadota bacterium]
MAKLWWTVLVLLVASVVATTWILAFDGVAQATDWFWQAFSWVDANRGAALLVFFVISLVSQMIVMPSGSLMLLFAGFALGGWAAAGVFAVAQFLTAWPMYYLSGRAIVSVEQGFLKGTATEKIENIRGQLQALKGNDFLASALLRLTPVIPSAGACLLAAVSKISLTPFLLATAVTCWIRPLFFASSGAALSEVVLRGSAIAAIEQLNLWPLLLVFVAVAILFVASTFLKRRVQAAR